MATDAISLACEPSGDATDDWSRERRLPSSHEPSLRVLNLPASPRGALATLAEPIARWFAATFPAPTQGQRFAWPALTQCDNLLLCAPTGTGKTLAAFLPVIGML